VLGEVLEHLPPAVEKFVTEAPELGALPMATVVRHLPQVERFTWQVA
jgi:hypothetical protein